MSVRVKAGADFPTAASSARTPCCASDAKTTARTAVLMVFMKPPLVFLFDPDVDGQRAGRSPALPALPRDEHAFERRRRDRSQRGIRELQNVLAFRAGEARRL